MNRAVWEPQQRVVQAVHPRAKCLYYFPRQRFQVVDDDGTRIVELSGEWETESMAWYDAARRLERSPVAT